MIKDTTSAHSGIVGILGQDEIRLLNRGSMLLSLLLILAQISTPIATLLVLELEPVWVETVSGIAEHAPLVDDGVVYVADNANITTAFRLDDGEILWSGVTGGIAAGKLVIHGDSILLPAKDGSVYQLDRKSGEVVTTTVVSAAALVQIVVQNDLVAVLDGAGLLTSLDATDMSIINHIQLAAPPSGDPIVVDSTLVVASIDGSITATDLSTLEPIWYTTVTGANPQLGELGTGDIAVGVEDGTVFSLSVKDGSTNWASISEAGPVLQIVPSGTGVLVTQTGGALTRFDAESGANEWEQTLPGNLEAAAAPSGSGTFSGESCDEVCFVIAAPDSIVLLDAERGEFDLATIAPAPVSAEPVASGEYLVVVTTTGEIIVWNFSGAESD